MINVVRVVRRHLKLVATDQYPKDHLFGMKVPQGGSACSKCQFVSDDKKHCGNDYFQKWRESKDASDPSLIPGIANTYCCDVFEAKR